MSIQPARLIRTDLCSCSELMEDGQQAATHSLLILGHLNKQMHATSRLLGSSIASNVERSLGILQPASVSSSFSNTS